MKLENNNKIDYQSTLTLEGIDSVISEDKIGKMWDMLQAPYKNSIGSIVREITSNCFDSHTEAKVDDAVVINIQKDETGYFIEFCDVGTGLSPERIKQIYSKYLESTKEDSNDFHGCFGIGSKSPLSYTDIFFITTTHEGIEYQYIMRKGEKSPRIEKLLETPIQQRNGTKIKIHIQPSDVAKFIKECQVQLAYFDNVYVNIDETIKAYYTVAKDYSNDYSIYEGKHFKLRSQNYPFTYTHMCIGKVAYPIDYNNLGTTVFNLPIALKFDIGDLPVTFTREDIRYNEESIRTVKNKLKLAYSEIIDLYNDQDFVKKSYNLFELYNIKDKYNAGILNLDENTSIDLGTVTRETFINYTEFSKDSFTFKDERIGLKKDIKIITCKEFTNLPINFSIYGNVNEYFVKRYFTPYKRIALDGRTSDYGKRGNAFAILFSNIRTYSPNSVVTLVKDTDLNIRTNKYIGMKVFKEAKTKVIPENLRFSDLNYVHVVTKNRIGLKEYKNILNLKRATRHLWRDAIKAYQKVVETEIYNKVENYSKHSCPDAWWEDYKKLNKAEPKEKDVSEITHYEFKSNIGLPSNYSNINLKHSQQEFISANSYRTTTNIDVLKTKNKLVYAHNDYRDLMMFIAQSDVVLKKDKHPIFMTVSKANMQVLEKMSNTQSLDDYIKDNKDQIIKAYITYYILTNSESLLVLGNKSRQYNSLYFLEIVNEGSIKDYETIQKTISDVIDVPQHSLTKDYTEYLKLTIDLINSYMKDTQDLDNYLKVDIKNSMDNLKKDLLKVKEINHILDVLNEFGVNDFNRYMGSSKKRFFEIFDLLGLVSDKSELKKLKHDSKQSEINDVIKAIKERTSKLSFYNMVSDNIKDLNSLIDLYIINLKNKEKINNLLQ